MRMRRTGGCIVNGVKPVVWTQALRDDPDVGKSRLAVLVMLSSRMRKDGTGWTLNRQLAADVCVSERTVERALEWAMGAGYLVRTRRGHRIKDGVAVGSEYRLTLPTTQPDTRDGLGWSDSPTDSGSQPDISESQPDKMATQPDTRDGLRDLSFKRPSFQEFRLSAGQSPNGDARDTAPNGEPSDPLQDPNADPFKVGARLGQLVASGELHDGDEHDEIRARYGHDTPDERAARAGYDRGRTAQDVPETDEAIVDALRPLTATPYNVGKRAAELFHAGAPVWRETFQSLLRDLFDRDHNAQAQAWVGYHQHGGHRYTDKRCDDCGEPLDWQPGGSFACSWCPDPYAGLPVHDGYTAHGIPRCMATRKAGQRCLTGARRKRRRVWPYCREHLQAFGVPAPADEDEQCRVGGCTDWSRANKATCGVHDRTRVWSP